ncbi:MAG: HD domain-containing protein [Planctomycetes bacterium]|nr:HD domain-containing protein [Planctomycetota bacterium]MCB9935686.1 HD domain-containing protein [Planctomycetota bacterium]
MLEDGHAYIIDLEPGVVHAIYLVQDARRLTTRNGKPYLALTLKDNTGSINAKRWDCSDEETALAKVGGYVEIQGEVELYRNTPQIIIGAMRAPAEEDIDRNAFEQTVSFDPAELLNEVREVLTGLPDEELRRLAETYLADEHYMARFEIGPAAQKMHHPYRFGLLEHVHSVMKLGERMCDHYPLLDRSMVLLGLFLHDSGKVVELVGEEAPSYSLEGELLGHITIGINLLDRKLQALPEVSHRKGVLLKHIILSHHGLQEWGSPKPPMTPEALVVHTIEMLDAKMNAFLREQAEPPETTDALGGLRWSKLLHRKILTNRLETTDAADESAAS